MAQLTEVVLLLLVSAGAVLNTTFARESTPQCGLRPVSPSLISPMIVNGHTPKYGSHPWQAGFRLLHDGQKEQYCGGTIFNEYWILSAAHCFDGVTDLGKWFVFVGDLDLRKIEASEQMFEVEKVIMHEKSQDSAFKDYDIALVKVKAKDGKGIQFDDNVQPACLPTPDTPYTPGKLCHISGWGKTHPDVDGPSVVLQAADVPLLSPSQCKEKMGHPESAVISPRHVCTGPVDPFGGACVGDSGGPLICKEEAGFTLMGITSWGPMLCGIDKIPSIFVKVKEYLTWIQEKMKA